MSEIKTLLLLCILTLMLLAFFSFQAFLQFFMLHWTFSVGSQQNHAKLDASNNIRLQCVRKVKFFSYEWLFIDTLRMKPRMFFSSSRISYNTTKNCSICENN